MMTTYRDFRWMQDAADDLRSIADSLATEADETNARGDTAAAIGQLEKSGEVSKRGWDLRMEFLKEPAFDQFRTLCLAQGSELTGEAVTRLAAAAAAKRGMTLRELDVLSAVEVAAMAASDAASHAEQPSNEAERLRELFTAKQGQTLIKFLYEQLGKPVPWSALPEEAFRDRETMGDETIVRALKRLRDPLTNDGKYEITISEPERTTTLKSLK